MFKTPVTYDARLRTCQLFMLLEVRDVLNLATCTSWLRRSIDCDSAFWVRVFARDFDRPQTDEQKKAVTQLLHFFSESGPKQEMEQSLKAFGISLDSCLSTGAMRSDLDVHADPESPLVDHWDRFLLDRLQPGEETANPRQPTVYPPAQLQFDSWWRLRCTSDAKAERPLRLRSKRLCVLTRYVNKDKAQYIVHFAKTRNFRCITKEQLDRADTTWRRSNLSIIWFNGLIPLLVLTTLILAALKLNGDWGKDLGVCGIRWTHVFMPTTVWLCSWVGLGATLLRERCSKLRRSQPLDGLRLYAQGVRISTEGVRIHVSGLVAAAVCILSLFLALEGSIPTFAAVSIWIVCSAATPIAFAVKILWMPTSMALSCTLSMYMTLALLLGSLWCWCFYDKARRGDSYRALDKLLLIAALALLCVQLDGGALNQWQSLPLNFHWIWAPLVTRAFGLSWELLHGVADNPERQRYETIDLRLLGAPNPWQLLASAVSRPNEEVGLWNRFIGYYF